LGWIVTLVAATQDETNGALMDTSKEVAVDDPVPVSSPRKKGDVYKRA